MPRRGENIRKRKDGRWEGRYYAPEPCSGRNVSHSIYAKTYREVKEKLSEAKRKACKVAEEKESPAAVNFGLAAEEWIAGIENVKKYSTYIKYRSIYEKYIQKKLSEISVSELDENILANVFWDDAEKELSDSIQKSILCVLNQILSYASAHYHTDFSRCSRKKPKSRNRQAEALNQMEQAKLLKYLYSGMDIYKLGIVICISTGLRLGEICSLKWEDIDFERKVLYVNRTVQRIAVEGHSTKTVLMEGDPKSIFSRREIPLSNEIIKLIFPYYGGADNYVINDDKPMEPRTYQIKFQKYLQMAGVERKNFHILRHTFATNCINNGTDIKSLSEILGHSDVKITLNRYVHPTLETKRQHMNSLSAIYGQFVGQ